MSTVPTGVHDLLFCTTLGSIYVTKTFLCFFFVFAEVRHGVISRFMQTDWQVL